MYGTGLAGAPFSNVEWLLVVSQLVHDGSLLENGIIRLDEYVCNVVQDRKLVGYRCGFPGSPIPLHYFPICLVSVGFAFSSV